MGVTNVQNTTTARNEMLRKVETHKKTGLERFTCITVYLIEYKKKNNYTDPTSLRSLLHTQNITIKKNYEKGNKFIVFLTLEEISGRNLKNHNSTVKIKARESRWTQCAAAYRRKMQSITKQYLNLLDENNWNKRNLRK